VTFYLPDDRSFGKGKKIANDHDIYDLNGSVETMLLSDMPNKAL
jgi:hypothetical protein